MPIAASVQNSFIGGLKTEFTGLNFPENSATDTDNCVYSTNGRVHRRLGIEIEENGQISLTRTRTNLALNTHKWKNVSGDGLTEMLVAQIGHTLFFYRTSDGSPISGNLLGGSPTTAVDMTDFVIPGTIFGAEYECQFADGNGYLFVFHPGCDPFYVVYDPSIQEVEATRITIQIRDFMGFFENQPVDYRPPLNTNQHFYNLRNQGWGDGGTSWTATDSTLTVTSNPGVQTFTVAAGLPITPGDNVQIIGEGLAIYPNPIMTGYVTAYVGTALSINVLNTTVNGIALPYIIKEVSNSHIVGWFGAFFNFPSNADVWWRFKNTSGVFDPLSTAANVTLGSGRAQRGHFVVNAFDINRSYVSSIPDLENLTTTARPSTGTWFQGRIWYSGVSGSFPGSDTLLFYPWSENIYFSQIIEESSQFGLCYQNNDPTDEEFFDLLPTDGGVITIQGSGLIYKLFPIQNGLLVFAANGIWFITGSQGIGFSANDYTVTKISAVQTISGTSFISVDGLPMFWNEEGIYLVSPSPQGGGLIVNNLCTDTIQRFYAEIPTISKKFVRGDYNPLDNTVKWVFRSNEETSITTRYEFNRVLNFDTSTKAFYPYTVSQETDKPYIHDVKYITIPGGIGSSPPVFKYWVSIVENSAFFFAEERDDETWLDFASFSGGMDYTSYFVVGNHLAGKALVKSQPNYVQMFSNANYPVSYTIQGIWDYANSPNSGKYSSLQQVTNALSRFGILIRRHKIRGRGFSLQLKISSVPGYGFDFIGWSFQDLINESM